MHNKCAAPRARNRRNKSLQVVFAILIVDTDTALDRDGDRDARAHRRNAFANKARLCHEARTEASLLHAIRRTAHVEIDLVVSKANTNLCCLGKRVRIAAPEL